jgi:hypothetical protein
MKRSLAAGVIFLAATLASADTKVDCAKGESINTALSKLKKTEPNVVKVAGTCAEDVTIEGFDNLRLAADGPAVLTPATASSNRILLVNASRLVAIDGFAVNIAGPQTWVAEYNDGASCAMTNMNITGGGGVRLQRSSNVAITDVAFHNASIGIIVGNGCQADIRGVTIEFTPPGTGNIGIAVFSGSTAFVEGTSISGYNTGALASGGELFVPGLGIFDTARPVVIEHNRVGVSSGAGGFVQFSASTQVKNNGNGGDLTGGVVVNGGFLGVSANVPALGSIEISDNNGQGVLLMNNGTSNIAGSAAFVTNNHLNGVAVVNGAVGAFGNAANVTGNGAKDIFCDDRSLVTGSAAVVGATKVQCTNLLPGALPPMPHPAP